jgi:hypothetical protein
MEMETETETSNASSTTSRRSIPLSRWIGEQLTIVAEVFGQTLSAPRLKLYVEALIDLGQSRLAIALQRVVRECKWWPKPAEIRELAGACVADERMVRAEAAWQQANDYLNEWGVERLPIYRAGKKIKAPPIPPEIDYALRRIGGLRGLNQITQESRPFMFRHFCESYLLAPTADAFGYLSAVMPERAGLTGETENLAANWTTSSTQRLSNSPMRRNRMPETATRNSRA